jgi:3-hydroxyacyl-[acyl-carrier-protein] dehydratase
MKLDMEKIMKVLPHRGAMLMLDGIEELDYGRRAVGYKDVSSNEFWCGGHFPSRAILPGVLIIEMMAQVSAFLFVKEDGTTSGIPTIAKVEEVKFLGKVYPDSRLLVEALFDVEGAGFVRARCNAFCESLNRLVAKGILTCCLSRDEGNSK